MPSFDESTSTFGSEGDTTIAQYHGRNGSPEVDPPTATAGVDFETMQIPGNTPTNAATGPATTTRLRVNIFTTMPRRGDRRRARSGGSPPGGPSRPRAP